jgi:hypothetical protein
MSATRRKSLATQRLVTALGTNQNAAITAALEVINERLAWDSALQNSLRDKYAEITALSERPPAPPRERAPRSVSGNGPARASTLEQLNPYDMLEDAGRDQLRAKLQGTTQRRLRSAVDVVQQRNPGTRPSSRSSNAAMIDYIVEMLAGSGY